LHESVAQKVKTIAISGPGNFSPQYRTAMRVLMDKDDVVFCISDKNLGLSAMDKDDYVKECNIWLDKTHIIIDADVTADSIISKVRDAIRLAGRACLEDWDTPPKQRHWITNWLVHSLTCRPGGGDYLIAAFRIMPKPHKTPVEFRPTMGNHVWITQPGATLIAWLLLPFVKRTPAFTKDSDSVIRDLDAAAAATQAGTLFDAALGDILFSFDVCTLYPSIQHGHCLQTLRAYLSALDFEFTELVLQLLEIILTMNYCEFNGRIYLQTVGFATGVACGAEVANLYLAAMEWRGLRRHLASDAIFQSGYSSADVLTAADLLAARPRSLRYLRRYIDDGFGIWRGELATLLTLLHSLYHGSGLRITVNTSTKSIIVLDMELFVDDGSILTKCYQKPACNYLYLPYSSDHPSHVWHAFLRGEAIRYVKRCSRRADYDNMITLFVARLQNRGYPQRVIQRSLATVNFKERHSYLTLKPPSDSQRQLPFVLTYRRSVFDAEIHNLFRENLKWIDHLPHFKAANFFISWRAGTKLGQELITYRFPKRKPGTDRQTSRKSARFQI